MKYLCKLHWMWAGRFREEDEFYISDKKEIEPQVKQLLIRIARHYTFDCNDLEHPLHPFVSSLEVIPIEESERIYPDVWMDEFLRNEMAWTEKLTKENKLYVNGNYDMTPAPENSVQV